MRMLRQPGTWRAVEHSKLEGLAMECTMAIELQLAELRVAELSASGASLAPHTAHADSGGDARASSAESEVDELREELATSREEHSRQLARLTAERAKEVLAVRHRCRSLLVTRNGVLA